MIPPAPHCRLSDTVQKLQDLTLINKQPKIRRVVVIVVTLNRTVNLSNIDAIEEKQNSLCLLYKFLESLPHHGHARATKDKIFKKSNDLLFRSVSFLKSIQNTFLIDI